MHAAQSLYHLSRDFELSRSTFGVINGMITLADFIELVFQ